jgi:hypothetical protein
VRRVAEEHVGGAACILPGLSRSVMSRKCHSASFSLFRSQSRNQQISTP